VITVDDLRCEHAVAPIGIGTREPRLSWSLVAAPGTTDVVQEAWQVEAGIADDVLWESGRVTGRDQRTTVPADGPRPLRSRDRWWWRVRAWTNRGETVWSEPSTFEIGLLEPADWQAVMIKGTASTPVVSFRSTIELDDDPEHARLYVTSQGVVAVTINGDEVGDEVLAPGWTSYDDRLVVRTHDVGRHLRRGTNHVEAVVAPGWFSGRLGFDGGGQVYGEHVALLAQLEVRDAAGAVRATLATDVDRWEARSTGFLLAELYDGETYDAGAGHDAGAVSVVEDFATTSLVWPAVAPVRRTQTLEPVEVAVHEDGVLGIDFGQNLVGRLRLRVRNRQAGDRVVLRHAEVLGPDGRLFTAPLRTAKATDVFIAAGATGEEEYEPTFTFHGFRFVEIEGVDIADVDVQAVVIHSDLERIGTFSCSDDLIDRLHENVVWGMRGNFLSVPTDCPQRDERLGWTGDAQVFSSTASTLYDCETFWENWLADLARDQLPTGSVPHVIPDLRRQGMAGAAGWGDAAVTVPWSTYVHYGDVAVLRAALPSMVAWVDYVHSRLDDERRWMQDFQFGDWLDPDAPANKPWQAKARFDLVATAYAAHSTSLLARAASLIDADDVAARMAPLADDLRSAWWSHFGDAARRTQTGCAMAIEFELAPDDEAVSSLGAALSGLVRDADGHLSTGFLGTPLLLPALTRTGHVDVAFEVLQQETCPSWLYQVLAGGTTIWERWDALRPDGTVAVEGTGPGSGSSMVSFNHYAYGAVADWLYGSVVGLAPDPSDPGYRHVVVEPHPGGRLTSASASLRTRFGPTSVSWTTSGDALALQVSIPPGAHATIRLPGGESSEVGSGEHEFEAAVAG
jgi:alpha-L-rhamnosidase